MKTSDLTKELLKHALESTALTDSAKKIIMQNGADIAELDRIQARLSDKMEELVVFATSVNNINEDNSLDDTVVEVERLHKRVSEAFTEFSDYTANKRKRADETIADKVYKAFLLVFFFLVAPLSVYYLAVAPVNYPMFLDLPILIGLYAVSINMFSKFAQPYLK